MIKQFLTVAGLLAAVVTAEAQGKFKFGVHIDPTISFMGSNEKAVTRAGSNVALGFGVQGDIYLNEGQNYAVTIGLGFLAGAGGKLKYRDGGRLLPNSDLDKSAFVDAVGERPLSGENLSFTQGTTIKYGVNYFALSAGFKLTTEEFGGSYMRAFFHLPTIDILIPVSARGTVNAPAGTNNGAYLHVGIDSTGRYSGMYSGESKKENLYSEIYPVQLAAGLGAGIEYSPNKEGGIRIIGGIYYSAAIFDMTRRVELYDPLDTQNLPADRYVTKNPRSAFQNVSLRIGVMF
jgi:hypothetical protein